MTRKRNKRGRGEERHKQISMPKAYFTKQSFLG